MNRDRHCGSAVTEIVEIRNTSKSRIITQQGTDVTFWFECVQLVKCCERDRWWMFARRAEN